MTTGATTTATLDRDETADARWLVGVAALLTLAVVGATLLFDLGIARGRALLPLHLGAELNVAAWWSGAVLLVAAIAAARRGGAAEVDGARRGWWSLAALLVLLSLTEVGSLHERLDGAAFILLLLVVAGTSAVAVVALLRRRQTRAAGFTVTISLAVLAVTLLQEHLRRFVSLLDDVPLMAVGAEETLELVAFLGLLVAAARSDGDGRVIAPALSRLRRPRQVVAWATAAHLLAVGASLVIPLERQHGDVTVWLPTAAFLALALEGARRPDDVATRVRVLGWLAASAAVASTLSLNSLDRLVGFGVPADGRLAVGLVLVASAVGLAVQARAASASAAAVLLGSALVVAVAVALGAQALLALFAFVIPAVGLAHELRDRPPGAPSLA